METQIEPKKQNASSATIIDNVKGGIAIPAILYFAGVPLLAVILLWALFFRG